MKFIKNESDYGIALAMIEKLIDQQGKILPAQEIILEELVSAVEEYEERLYPIDPHLGVLLGEDDSLFHPDPDEEYIFNLVPPDDDK